MVWLEVSPIPPPGASAMRISRAEARESPAGHRNGAHTAVHRPLRKKYATPIKNQSMTNRKRKTWTANPTAAWY